MIEWAIEAVVSSGIDEIMLVTGGTHAGEFLRLLGNGREYGIHQLSYAYQEKAGGIAEALGLAEHFAGGDPVLVMLADNVLERSIKPMVDAFCADPTRSADLAARGCPSPSISVTSVFPCSAMTAGSPTSRRSPRTRSPNTA